jgi:DNA repair exonuclease SbcCD ATPase subunit
LQLSDGFYGILRVWNGFGVGEQRDALKKDRAEQESGAPALTSLALLREHGGKLGLQDGKCPLCGSPVTAEKFEAHLKAIDESVHLGSQTLAGLIREESRVDREYEFGRLEVSKVNTALSEARNPDHKAGDP